MFLETSFLEDEEIYLDLVKTTSTDPDKNWLPAYYFTIRLKSGEKIGYCDLRIGYNQNVYYGGNIGYGVHTNFRGHHYAGKACRLLFLLAKKHGMDYLIITCDPDNIASRRTCEYVGGILQEIVDLPEENDMYQEGARQKCIYRFEN